MNLQAAITVYDPFRAQLSELQEHNSSLVFDYEDPKGNKDARSHIYQLRRTKTAIDKARKDAGKDVLEFKRKVDAEGKELIAEVEDMIIVHQKPIDEIEERERLRVERAQNTIKDLIVTGEMDSANPAETIQAAIDSILAMDNDDSFGEFEEDIKHQKAATLQTLKDKLKARQAYEAEREELERLRREAAERERKEQEERMKQEAAERAKEEAEKKARAEKEKLERERIAAEQAKEAAERRAKEAEERAERESREAAQRALYAAQQAKQQAEEAARLDRERLEAEKQAEKEAMAKRQADREYRRSVHQEILAAFIAQGLNKEIARTVIKSVSNGAIPMMSIQY